MKATHNIDNNPWVSYFLPPVTNTIPNCNLQLPDIHSLITGEGLRGITEQLRSLSDRKAQQAFKAANFPYVTFGGTFTKRNEQGLLQASNLLVLDFDGLEAVAPVRQLLLEDPYFETLLLFVSPSGKGLKWVVRKEEPEVSQKDFFAAVVHYLESERGLVADASGSDLSRACYLGFDEGCVLHADYMRAGDSLL